MGILQAAKDRWKETTQKKCSRCKKNATYALVYVITKGMIKFDTKARSRLELCLDCEKSFHAWIVGKK